MSEHKLILQTTRVRLRTFVENDLENLMLVNSDPEVMAHFPATLNRAENAALLQRIIEKQERHGSSFWAAELKQSGAFIGMVGLLPQCIDGAHELEIAFRLARTFWGQGLATEAAIGCINYGFDLLRRDRLISLIRPVNARSIRVAERIGMQFEKMTLFHGFEHRFYAIKRLNTI